MSLFTSKLLAMLPWRRASDRGPAISAPAAPVSPATPTIVVEGTEPGWLRVLPAEELLASVRAAKALKEIWRQSRQSELVWRRDLEPAIYRYAEFVQLMPASEAHHHAHAGGLLSHTLEMLVAAMTWRNAHLLPANEQIEAIDSQRDQWTYVVFLAALLHDIAKPMTDLRIRWKSDGMADAIRWAPMGGSLMQITSGRKLPEYLVDFAPKSQRDYSAHARMAQLLLPRMAPESALAFLACSPAALDALNQYLSGQDKESLVASIVKRADQVSVQRALRYGSKARFATSRAVPLIDLLMQAIGSMLRSGTALPLNRSGAAGWVFDGAIWFVAKRLADGVREWIKTHEPDEAVPGDSKNDRLFDTWQEYGVIALNPHTGQAIWHVNIHGASAEQGGDRGVDSSQQGYMHELSVLKFPLAKLFENEALYPAIMLGHIEVKARRTEKAQDQPLEADADSKPHETDAGSGNSVADAIRNAGTSDVPSSAGLSQEEDAPVGTLQVPDPVPNVPGKQHEAAPSSSSKNAGGKSKPDKNADRLAAIMKAPPAFNKPKPKPAAVKDSPSEADAAIKSNPETGATTTAARSAWPEGGSAPQRADADAAYLLDDSPFLAVDESARAWKQPRPAKAGNGGTVRAELPEPGARPLSIGRTPPTKPPLEAASISKDEAKPFNPRAMLADLDDILPPILGKAAPDHMSNPEVSQAEPQPVLLKPDLPKLRKDGVGKPPAEPSALAVEFMHWVQQSLVAKDLSYNETGATVHFVPEGMALVSPLIFRQYAATVVGPDGAQDLGQRVQREVIKAGWHLPGPNKKNIVRYAVAGKGNTVVSHLSCVVLLEPGRWVYPVPPSNPVLKLQ